MGDSDKNRSVAWSCRSYDEQPWRIGRKVGRTIYAQQGAAPDDDDPLIGVMDTEWYAEIAVRAHNAEYGYEEITHANFV